MDSSANEKDIAVLLERHETLESRFSDGDEGRFLSGWQCENPYAPQISERIRNARREIEDHQYLYFEHDEIVRRSIFQFHKAVDGVEPPAVLCGLGATPLIFTVCAWLATSGVTEIFYAPPLYFSVHFALKLFGIRARPVSGRHMIEHGFTLNLPEKKSVLLLVDPVWYAGVTVPADTIERIAAWQRHTQSLVFVDGSFQYCRWDGSQKEHSAELDRENTMRVVCPTKSLASHGYRFAYLLLPGRMYDRCAHIHASIYGSASIDNLAMARVAMPLLQENTIPKALMQIVSNRHQALRTRGVISAPWTPDSGYFVFEKISSQLPEGTIVMDGSFFEQRRYQDYARINLLSPSLSLLN